MLGTARRDMTTKAFARWPKRRSRNICRPTATVGLKLGFPEAPPLHALDASRPESFGVLSKALGNGGTQNLAIFLSTAPSLFQPAIAGLQSTGLTGEEARIGLEKPLGHDLASFRRSTTPCSPPSRRSGRSASTIISARRPCRTCWRFALATGCSSRCGTRAASTMSRSPCPRRWGWRAAAIL